MSHPLDASIARICTSDGAVVGAGFLVTDRYVLTCAHVIAAALDLRDTPKDSPSEQIALDFALVAPGQPLAARIAFWPASPGAPENPLAAPAADEDIAVLEVSATPPLGCRPVTLVGIEEMWERPVRAFGFPRGHDRGVYAEGQLRGGRVGGWVQLDGVSSLGYFVEPGFSGTAVWDEAAGGVVGMVASAEQRQERRAAFMIPTTLLIRAWPTLGKVPQTQSTVNPTQQWPGRDRLTGTQAKQLYDALLSAFTDRGELERMVSFGLDQSLAEIVDGASLRDVVFDLVRWSEARGRLRDLVAAAREANPGNPLLQTFADQIGIDRRGQP